MTNPLDKFSHQLADCWRQPQKALLHEGLETDDEIKASFVNCLQNPVGYYPALGESVFAGDTVAIVLQDTLPRPSVFLEAMLEQLMATNVAVNDISVVVSPETARKFGVELDPIHDEQEEREVHVYRPIEK